MGSSMEMMRVWEILQVQNERVLSLLVREMSYSIIDQFKFEWLNGLKLTISYFAFFQKFDKMRHIIYSQQKRSKRKMLIHCSLTEIRETKYIHSNFILIPYTISFEFKNIEESIWNELLSCTMHQSVKYRDPPPDSGSSESIQDPLNVGSGS